jgi:lipopolysaccharide export system protein LptA
MKKSKFILSILFILFFINSVIQPPILIGPEDIFKAPNLGVFPEEEKKKKTPTRWGGSSLTQTEKIIQGIPMTVFILGGGAWIFHQTIRISSSRIEIIGEDAIKADLKGRVLVEDKENGSTLSALKGDYDKLSDKIVLEGSPRLVYTASDKKKTYISAKRIIRYLEEGKTILEGQIYITNEEVVVVGEDAVYNDQEKTLVLGNKPMLFLENRFLSAEKLTYNTETGEVILDGNAFLVQKTLEDAKDEEDSPKGKFAPGAKKSEGKSKKEDEEKEKVWVRTLSFADQMLRSTKGDIPFTGLRGNAQILREDSEFYADEIRNYTQTGTEEEILEAKKDVRMVDLENKTVISGQYLEHFKDRGYSHITGKPKIEIQNDEGETTTTITSIEIERFEDKKEMVIRGDVLIQSESSKARGEYATYFEQEEKIVLEGDPSLERDGKNLHSGKIIIYPQDDRVILSEGLNIKGSQ